MLTSSFFSTPNLHANRAANESEFVPQLVDEKSLVREMERRRHVGEKHEPRRRDADLCRVEDADVSAPGTDGGICRGHGFEPSVQRRCRNPLLTCGSNLVDGLEH